MAGASLGRLANDELTAQPFQAGQDISSHTEARTAINKMAAAPHQVDFVKVIVDAPSQNDQTIAAEVQEAHRHKN